MKLNRKTEKFLINRDRVDQIHQDFSAIGILDEHAKDGTYRVRSVYFDNDQLEALKDRIAQKDNRKKFRIRLYNDDPSFVRLEEKVKIGDIGTKTDTLLDKSKVEKLLTGEINWLKNENDPLLKEFYDFIQNEHLHPMVVIEYLREPYTIPDKNIRLTLDYDIKASKNTKDFLDPSLELDDLIEDKAVIEIKWPDELPDEVVQIIERENLKPVNFSKYTSTYDYLTENSSRSEH